MAVAWRLLGDKTLVCSAPFLSLFDLTDDVFEAPLEHGADRDVEGASLDRRSRTQFALRRGTVTSLKYHQAMC